MKKLRVLIVEDDKEKLGPLLDRLSESEFDPDVRNTPNDALKRVQSSKFDVIFIDLQLTKEDAGKEPFYEGIALGEQLRRLAPEAAIVMYSGSIPRGQEKKFPHYKDCIEGSKADAVLARSELFSISSRQLEAHIKGWLESRRQLSAGVHVQFDSGLRTKAALEVIGPGTLEQIVVNLAKGMNHFRVTALQAGYSGAAILKVKASQSADFSAPNHLIIKVSSSKVALDDELNRLPKLGSYYDANAVLSNAQSLVERDGFYAIALREVCDMDLLRDFLRARGLTHRDKDMLIRVVRDLLIAPAKEARPWETFGITTPSFSLRASAGSEITDFLSGAAELKHVLKAVDLRAVNAAQEFLRILMEGVWSFTINGRLAAFLHGDFHCRNIFVAPADGPVLIDFGRAEVYPRLFDLAALDADLVLSIFDCDKGEDHMFTNVNCWYRDVTSSFPYSITGKTSNVTNKAAWLRQLLLSEMVKELPSVLPAEYAETLVFQFLRYLRFSNITLPKKILAARLIEHLIEKFGLQKSPLVLSKK